MCGAYAYRQCALDARHQARIETVRDVDEQQARQHGDTGSAIVQVAAAAFEAEHWAEILRMLGVRACVRAFDGVN